VPVMEYAGKAPAYSGGAYFLRPRNNITAPDNKVTAVTAELPSISGAGCRVAALAKTVTANTPRMSKVVRFKR
jgi:hypothetical protein